jgi:mRNA interferase RelE/StbE
VYRLNILREVLKALESVPKEFRHPIQNRIKQLALDPRPSGVKKLHRGGYRVRLGPYRIIYEIDDNNLLVNITAVKHRKDAYR